MIDVAIEAAKAGGKVGLKYFNSSFKVSYKPDLSPVTIADVNSEKKIREIITKKFPHHGIIGEELPAINKQSEYQWIIDPIDGTRDFVKKVPFWAVYLAVLKSNKPILGVIYFPVTGELITAEKGKSAYFNGKKIRLSKTKNLKDAYFGIGTLKRFIQKNKINELLAISKVAMATRSMGNYHLKLFLEGKIDGIIEPYGAIHDLAAPSIIVKEAGGKYTDFSGKDSITAGNSLATNGLLHSQVLKLLNS